MRSETEIIERRIGTTLRGKWKLERLLGVGGMAAVYVGVHKIGRRDAIKILHPEIAENKELAARFEQEAHAVNRFRHPGAVEILDIDVTEDGAPFLVMEMLQGESVETRIERQLLGAPETLRLADELLDVLAAAHATGIVHRDIKPDNLFLLEDGRLKVLDFGIARMRQGAPKTIYTRVGVTIGTLSYMPPEQVAGKEIDARADIFAAGCTLFRILTGRSPHEGNTELELMVKMAMEPAPPLAAVAPALPIGLCMVIDRSLAFDRALRYPDALTMQQDVRAVRAGQPPPYASERVAAGDLPNPRKAPSSVASPVSSMATAAAVIPVGVLAASAVGAMPTSMPIPVSMMMPAMSGAAPVARTQTNAGEEPASAYRALSPAMPPVSAPTRALTRAAPSQKTNEKAVALVGIGGMFLVLGIALTIWWTHRGPTDELAQGAEPSMSDLPATSASAQGAEAPPGADGNSVSPADTSAQRGGNAPSAANPAKNSTGNPASNPAAPRPASPAPPAAAPLIPAIPTPNFIFVPVQQGEPPSKGKGHKHNK